MRDIYERLAQLERQVKGMVRVGVVDTVDEEKCRATVCFPTKQTQDGQIEGPKTKPIPVLVKQTKENRDYWLPTIGEWVVVVALPAGVPGMDAFILGGWYSNADAIPEGAESAGMRMTEFEDGSRFEYNTEDSKLRVQVGNIEVQVTPDLFRVGGEAANQSFVRGNDQKSLLEALIDLLAQHTHPTGVGPSGPPANATALTAKKSEIDGTLSPIIKGR